MQPARRMGLIGFGAIGRSIVSHLRAAARSDIEIVGVCVRAHQLAAARSALPASILVTDRIDRLLTCEPDLVVEAAGQAAVVEYSAPILQAGVELLVLSLGALANAETRNRLHSVTRKSGAVLMIEATEVELVADPEAVSNTGRLLARGDRATLDVTLSSTFFHANPKTSEITSLSVIAALDNLASNSRFV